MRALHATLAAGVALAAALGCGPGAPPDPRPNVLLVVIDTLRADRLGAYGYSLGTSPEIDALAAGGVVFERAIAAGPWTGPSHASMLTSHYPRGHSVGFSTGRTRLEGLRTLAESFQEAGYTTAAFVSNFVLKRRFGWARGFDLYDDEFEDPEPTRPNVPERIAEETAARALAWIGAQEREPFFLWVHLQDPHGPYVAPGEHGGRIEIPAAADEEPLPVLPFNFPGPGIPRYQVVADERLPSEYAARYGDEILYADRFVGEIVRAVESHRSRRAAVVLITSDHGESFGENGTWFAHGEATTPDAAHVPMILRAPGLAAGRRSGLVSHVDVTPTLLEWAGLEPAGEAEGIALGPFLRDGRALPDRTVYCDRGRELSAYRRDGFLRVQGLPGARSADPSVGAPRWTRHPWPEGDWRTAGSEAAPDAEIERHLARRPPVRAMELDAQTREGLERLGYLGD